MLWLHPISKQLASHDHASISARISPPNKTIAAFGQSTWLLPHDSSERIPARWCPSLLAKLVHIIPITMVYGRYIYTYNGLKTNKHNWGGHHLVWIQTRFKPGDTLRMETLLQRAPMIWRDCDSHFSADPATEFGALQCEMIILTVNFGLQ